MGFADILFAARSARAMRPTFVNRAQEVTASAGRKLAA